jgi:MFS transporter, DHA1 family, multidrug resistance protein
VRIVDRVAPRPLVLTALAAMTCGAAGLVLTAATRTGGIVGLMIPLSVMLFSLSFVTTNTTGLALADHPEVAGTASALVGCLQFVIGGVLAPVTGLWAEGSATAMAGVMAAATVVALVTFAVMAGHPRAPHLGPVEWLQAEPVA